mmetsp:Transcript_16919/g.34245  ORF Transcript_16919/g.34245 Transcript_16919/m.34245 type:complete len:674 (+) Transcript_16919:99-2120(+)
MLMEGPRVETHRLEAPYVSPMSQHSAVSSASAPVRHLPRSDSLRVMRSKPMHYLPEASEIGSRIGRSKSLIDSVRAISHEFEAEPRSSLNGTSAFLKRVAKEVRACSGEYEHTCEERRESLMDLLNGPSFEIVRSRIEASLERMKLGDMAQLESLVLYQLLVRFEMVLSAGGGGEGDGVGRWRMASISPDLKRIDEAKAPTLAYFLAEGKRSIEEAFESRTTTVWKRQADLFQTIRQGMSLIFEDEKEQIEGASGGDPASSGSFDWLKPDELLLAMGEHTRTLLVHFLQRAYEQLNGGRSMLEWDTATIVSLCGEVLHFARRTFSRLSAGVSRRTANAEAIERKLHAVGRETDTDLRRMGDAKSVAVKLSGLRRACEADILGLERKAMTCMMKTWEQEFNELVATCGLFHEEWLDVAFTGGAQSMLTFWISNLQNFQNAARVQQQRKTTEKSTVDWKKKMDEVGARVVKETLDAYVFRLCDVFSSSLWAKMHLSHRSREDSFISSSRSKVPSRNRQVKRHLSFEDQKSEGAKYEQGKEEDEDAVSAEEVSLGVMRDANHLRNQLQNGMEKMGLLPSARSIKKVLGFMDIFGSISHILLTRYEDRESVQVHFEMMDTRFGEDAGEVLKGLAQVCEQHGGWKEGSSNEVEDMYLAYIKKRRLSKLKSCALYEDSS